MNFFDKLQEAVYDIIGYLIPGIIATVFFLPSFLLYVRKGILAFPVEAVLVHYGLTPIGWLSTIDLTSTLGLGLIFAAYLVGHVIKYLAEIFYKQIFKAESTLLGKEAVNTLNDVSAEAEEIFKSRFQNSDIDNYDDSEKQKVLTGYGRVQIRMHEVPSLVQKYISKYNFYRSLAFICLILIFNIIITFAIKFGLDWIGLLLVVAIIYGFICRKLNTASGFKALKKMCGFNGLLRCVFYIQLLYCFFTRNLFVYAVLYLITLLFYQAFIYEFRRHYRLSVKEALFGVLYVRDSKKAE